MYQLLNLKIIKLCLTLLCFIYFFVFSTFSILFTFLTVLNRRKIYRKPSIVHGCHRYRRNSAKPSISTERTFCIKQMTRKIKTKPVPLPVDADSDEDVKQETAEPTDDTDNNVEAAEDDDDEMDLANFNVSAKKQPLQRNAKRASFMYQTYQNT